MVYAYIAPLVTLVGFFISVVLVYEKFAMFFLYTFILVTFLLPFILLYRAEGEEAKKQN